jgi:Protein of unknown function (DUF4239)
MLNTIESILLVLFIVSASLALLFLIRRLWPIEQRRPHNDLIGWHITVLGTTYAVIIGFMLYAVWTNFELASGNAEAEADSLVNMARAADGLPDGPRQEVQKLAVDYVDVMLAKEWPAMSRLQFAPESGSIVDALWAALSRVQTTTSQQTSLDHAYTELSQMSAHRRLRQLQVVADLPGILWAVLCAGGCVTIVSACLFGSIDFRLHFVQVALLALILSLVLVAIADINRPFQGGVHIAPFAFTHARATIADLQNKDRRGKRY